MSFDWGNFADAAVTGLIPQKQSRFGDAPVPTSNSVPASGSNDDLASWLNRGVAIYKAVTGSKTLESANPPDNPTKASQQAGKTSSYVPWILGGGLLLVVLYFVFRR